MEKEAKYEKEISNFKSVQVVGCCTEDSFAEGFLGRKKQKRGNQIFTARMHHNEVREWNDYLEQIISPSITLHGNSITRYDHD